MNTFFQPFLLFSFFSLSALSSPLWSFQSCLFYFHSFFSLSFLLSFLSTNPQSLDQVALTNATILDGSGGGPNGSLAGSVGSVAVCLPSESSLTDSLHTSAVSLHRIDVGSRNNLYDRKENVTLDASGRWQHFGVHYCCSDVNIVTHSLSGILL